MNSEKLARATFVLSKPANDDLAYLASRMGRSRSSLVREVLEPAVVHMAKMLRYLPPEPTEADLDLFRDVAVTTVDRFASSAKRAVDRD